VSLRPAHRTPGTTPGGRRHRAPEAHVPLATAAYALATSDDVAAHVDVCGRGARAAAGGTEWRFDHFDPETGSVRAGGPDGPTVLPEPGGTLEWMLRHGELLLREDAAAEAFGDGACGAVLGLPVRSGGALLGVLRVALPQIPLAGPADPGVAEARAFADLCGLGLERDARARELARTRARLEEASDRAGAGEALFGELIGVVAHEIRTPLTSIKAYTETLIDAPSDEFERRREFLHVIDEECDRLARLVGDALDLSKLEAGLRLLRVRSVSPAAILEDVATTLEPDATRNGVALVLDSADAPVEVEGDADLLKQLLFNLVGNAIKFSPSGTTVTLSACVAPDGAWRVSVTDQGGGIPEDQLERIFERFHRVELRDGRRVHGTGLGLAIARHVTDLHGGRLWVENASTGGSIFAALLPLRQLAPMSVRALAESLVERPEVIDLLDAAVGMISDVMDAEIVSALLVDPDAGDLHVAAARGLDEVTRERRMHFRGGVAGAVLAAGEPVRVDDIETDPRFRTRNHPQYSTKSLLCAPLAVGGVTVGVVNVTDRRSRVGFTEADLELLTGLVSRLSAALSRVHAYPESAAVVAEAKAAVQSAARVEGELSLGPVALAHHARAVAKRLGADVATITAVARLAGGDASPWADDGDGSTVRALLLARGERVDGSGRPSGLRGEAIPLGARILAVIDEFARLTRGRPYRAALGVDDALEALRAAAGVRFDAAAVDALAAVLADEVGDADALEEAA